MLTSEYTIEGIPISNLKPRSEKRIQLRCDGCGKLTETSYANYTTYSQRASFDGRTWCKQCSVKIASKRNIGKPSKSKGISRPHTWKQGISSYIDSNGYRMIRIQNGKLNRKSGWSQYKKEHILIMESFLGRHLVIGETIHHIDGNKLNNSLDNLWLCSNNSHKEAHQTLQEIGYYLIQNGLVTFDKTNGRYMANIKFRELLEQLEAANQQPSLGSNSSEGSTTNAYSPTVI